jgi:type I restriction enzyme S subunit
MPFEPGTYKVEQLIALGILEVGDGYRAKNNELAPTGYPFARAGNINDGFRFADADRFPEAALGKVGSKVSRPGDVVFTSKGTVGRFAFVTSHTEQFVYSPQLCFWRSLDHEVLDPRFLYFWMQGPEFMGQIDYLKGQTDMADYVSLRDQRRMTITVAPYSTQQTVAATLGSIDDRINLLRQTNATLESIAEALFKSWFIDFDPVRAKAEGGEPDGMDAATAALFPAEFEESALGLIPKGWQCTAIRNVVQDVYDGPHATPPEASEGPFFLGIKNLTGTRLDLSEIRYIGEDNWAQWTRRVTPMANDIVFSYEAALGLFALIPPGLRCCLGRRLALVRPKATVGTPHFWFHQFIGAPFQQLLAKHTVHGATVNRIALKEFPSYPVLDPGQAARDAFETIAVPLWARIHLNQQQALDLTKLRDALLPRLISGKLSLPEAQVQI